MQLNTVFIGKISIITLEVSAAGTIQQYPNVESFMRPNSGLSQ